MFEIVLGFWLLGDHTAASWMLGKQMSGYWFSLTIAFHSLLGLWYHWAPTSWVDGCSCLQLLPLWGLASKGHNPEEAKKTVRWLQLFSCCWFQLMLLLGTISECRRRKICFGAGAMTQRVKNTRHTSLTTRVQFPGPTVKGKSQLTSVVLWPPYVVTHVHWGAHTNYCY